MTIQKTYQINKSPLYRLGNKRKLAKLFGCDHKDLIKIESSRKDYITWREKKKNGKTRPIESPKYKLKKLQKKLQKLLSRIETPNFLMSGKKGLSFVDNAKHHTKSSNYMLCVDIKGFYQAVKRNSVFKSLKKEFEILADDVAWILTDIITIPDQGNKKNGYLPTGAPTSQIIAFWTYKTFFSAINEIANKQNIKMSVYVDDLTFSSNKKIPKSFLTFLYSEFSKQGLSIKNNKVKFTTKGKEKHITGTVIDKNNQLKIPNKKRKEIIDCLKQKKISDMSNRQKQVLFGKIVSTRQIEPNAFSNTYLMLKKRICFFK